MRGPNTAIVVKLAEKTGVPTSSAPMIAASLGDLPS